MLKHKCIHSIKVDKYPNDKYIDEYDEKMHKLSNCLAGSGIVLVVIWILLSTFKAGMKFEEYTTLKKNNNTVQQQQK